MDTFNIYKPRQTTELVKNSFHKKRLEKSDLRLVSLCWRKTPAVAASLTLGSASGKFRSKGSIAIRRVAGVVVVVAAVAVVVAVGAAVAVAQSSSS